MNDTFPDQAPLASHPPRTRRGSRRTLETASAPDSTALLHVKGEVFPVHFREYVENYVHDLMNGPLRLGNWVLTIDWKGTDEECYASMTPDENSHHVVLRLSPTFLSLNEHRQRQTLVHELVHCHLFSLHHTAEEMLETTASLSAFKVASRVLESRVEVATDALADVISPLCPPFSPPETTLL